MKKVTLNYISKLKCNCCLEETEKLTIIEVKEQRSRNRELVCDDCLKERIVKCKECEEYVFNDNVSKCDKCGKEICNEHLDYSCFGYEGERYCSDCIDVLMELDDERQLRETINDMKYPR